jgi:hypothetical protein
MRPQLLAEALDDLDERIQELYARKKVLIDLTVAGCSHPLEAIYELPYKPHEWLQADAPWLICSLCGYTEEGWGCGYKKLRHAEYAKPPTITKEQWLAMRTVAVMQERE